MKLRRTAGAAALILAGMLLLTGCVPGFLLPHRHVDPAPNSEPTSTPAPETAPEPAAAEPEDDSEDAPEGISTELYSWISQDDDRSWIVTVDDDMSAFAMHFGEDEMITLTGTAKKDGKGLELTLAPAEFLSEESTLDDRYTFTIDDVSVNDPSMTIVKNGEETATLKMEATEQ